MKTTRQQKFWVRDEVLIQNFSPAILMRWKFFDYDLKQQAQSLPSSQYPKYECNYEDVCVSAFVQIFECHVLNVFLYLSFERYSKGFPIELMTVDFEIISTRDKQPNENHKARKFRHTGKLFSRFPLKVRMFWEECAENFGPFLSWSSLKKSWLN